MCFSHLGVFPPRICKMNHQARTQGGSGGSEEPSRAATRSAQPNKILFFFNFYVLFVSGPCCNHSVFTARMHKIAGFGSIFPKIFRGSMPPDPLEELGRSPSTFWSAWKQKEPTRLDSCVRPWPFSKAERSERVENYSTVKLGLYVHGLVRTLGYNVLSVDHGHRQSENMYIFSDKTYRTWHKIGYYVPIFPPRALFALSLVLFFLITSMSSNLSVSISISRHVFKFTMPRKAISPYEKRIMNHMQDGDLEASSVADRSREHVEPVLPVRKIAFWIERTLVTPYLFSFPSRVRNNRVSL